MAGCQRSYTVGDLYRSNEGNGIVVTTDSTGAAQLILSVDEIADRAWDSAMALQDTAAQGWRLPTSEEMKTLYAARIALNEALTDRDMPKIFGSRTWYWTSTPCSETHAYAWGPDGLKCYYKENSSPLYRVRMVKVLCTITDTTNAK